MKAADVIVVGAGPAGATASLNLAPLRTVLTIDHRSAASLASASAEHIGESLAPAARRLLTDMGLYESFLQLGHAPCYGNRSVWGGAEIIESDFLRDPDGHGYHLDRAQFDRWLRNEAVGRGAMLAASTRIESVERAAGGWLATLRCGDILQTIEARFLIDAGGRFAPLARRLGATRRSADEMVCCWIRGHADPEGQAAGFTFIEAVRDGWWYTAPLPQGKRIVAFHTDKDLPASQAVRNTLLDVAAKTPTLSTILSSCSFRPDGDVRVTRAGGSELSPCASEGWLAAGDAALSFDPLAAQGLFNALYTGLAAAEVADAFLNGDHSHLNDYADSVRSVYRHYELRRRHWYRQETRWPDSAFWQRRAAVEVVRELN